MKKTAKEFIEANSELLKREETDPQSEEAKKDALGFIELTYSFVEYQKKVNGYRDDLKGFIKKDMTEQDMKQRLRHGAFITNRLRGKAIYDMCHKYGMRWESFEWVNTFRHPEEAKENFKEMDNYSGDYAEKIYSWA